MIRPLLVAKWIVDHGTQPPMLLRELLDAELPGELRPIVDELLDKKQKMPEMGLAPRIGELDRFIDAMLAIRAEIDQVKAGVWPLEDNPLVNAPHIQSELVAEWAHPYSREVAVFPAGVADKYWPTVKRLDDVYGDRNLFCSCVPISEYQ